MRAHALNRMSCLALVCVALMGCNGGGSEGVEGEPRSGSDTPNSPSANSAENILGAALLPPDGVVAAATVLSKDEFPPGDVNALLIPAAADLAPDK